MCPVEESWWNRGESYHPENSIPTSRYGGGCQAAREPGAPHKIDVIMRDKHYDEILNRHFKTLKCFEEPTDQRHAKP